MDRRPFALRVAAGFNGGRVRERSAALPTNLESGYASTPHGRIRALRRCASRAARHGGFDPRTVAQPEAGRETLVRERSARAPVDRRDAIFEGARRRDRRGEAVGAWTRAGGSNAVA